MLCTMQEVKTKKYKGSLLLKFAIFSFVIYILYLIVSQQINISDKKTELNDIQQQVTAQQNRNEEIQYTIDEEQSGQDEYAEEYARSELDYAKQGERVFVNIGGN
jgi:cell division protein FtsB